MARGKEKHQKQRQQLLRERQRRDERKRQLGREPLLYQGLDEIRSLLKRGELEEASARLEELDREFPRSKQLLQIWCDVCYDLRDEARHLDVAEKLYALDPGDADVSILLAGLYLANVRPGLGNKQFGEFLRRFPNDPRVPAARRTYADLESAVSEIRSKIGGEHASRVMELHERTLQAMSLAQPSQAATWAKQLLAVKPDFLPALNNLAEAQVLLGDVEGALETLRGGLAFDAANAFTQGSLARALILAGNADEARRMAESFNLTSEDTADAYFRQAEAYHLLGNFEAAFQLAERRRDCGKLNLDDAKVLHAAAVAAARLGRENDARRLWKEALQLDSNFSIARENLDDLRKPAGKRHGPWLLGLSQRVPYQTLSGVLGKTAPKDDLQAIERLLELVPHLPRLVPILLDQGDENSRSFAISLAEDLDTPEMRKALFDYVLSDRGPDEQRMQAAMFLGERGALPSRDLNLWREGERQATRVHGFNIHRETENLLGDAAQELHDQAYAALQDGDGPEAERLLRQALEIEFSPSLCFNLAASLLLQDKKEEAEALQRDLHARYPDYYFGRIWKAKTLIREREFEAAQKLLNELADQPRHHVSEFASLCDANMELLLAKGDKRSAECWLSMLEGAEPEHPYVFHWRLRLIDKQSLFERFGKLLSR
jgi:predicted Zn-dependent protease